MANTELETKLLAALIGLVKEIPLRGLNIRKDFSLINAHAAATKAIAKATEEVSNDSRWTVECRYLGGWDDAEWTEDGKPLHFKTKKAAEAEIDELIREQNHAYRRGHMGSPQKRSDYRAVKEKK